ncbi:endonuclease III [cyanobiont of Ornithocercus magnificus]|nr:endonuclease III [cyanobiont of Ornithocercus magnificus]
MHQKERVVLIQTRLNQHYPTTPIPLNHYDAFTLLVSVLLSAQCTDKKVNEVTPALFKAGPTPAMMAKLEETEIISFIKQLGLSRTKARNIRRLSELLVEQHSGNVPCGFAELEALPGVGHKTASVVMSQAFGIPTFPVDTHIHRLAQRWGLSSGLSVKQTEHDLKRLFPKQFWNRLHLQIIFWGRDFCTARGCDGTICALCKELYPQRRMPVAYHRA